MVEEKLNTKNTNFTNSKLNYLVPDEVVIVTQRRTVSVQAPITRYASSSVIDMTFGSEQDYIFGPNCYLMFKVKEVATNTVRNNTLSAYGSLVNVIKEIKFSAKSMELEHLRGVDTLAHIKDHYVCPDGYLDHTGTLMGYKNGISVRSGQGGDYAIIPLHHISGFFSQDKYIPLPELGNVRMELTLNSHNDAFTDGTINGNGADYEITEFKIVLDAYRMTDVILGAGRNKAKNGQLAMSFDTYHYDRASLNQNAMNTIELKKSVSKALSAFARVKTTPGTAQARYNNLAQGAGSMAHHPTDIVTNPEGIFTGPWVDGTSRYQWINGTEYHPNFVVSNGKQAFAEALKAFGNLSNVVRHPTVNYTSWKEYNNIIAVELERDIDSNDLMSGVSTKEGNRIVLEYHSADVANQFVEIFLHHLRLILVHPSSILIKE